MSYALELLERHLASNLGTWVQRLVLRFPPRAQCPPSPHMAEQRHHAGSNSMARRGRHQRLLRPCGTWLTDEIPRSPNRWSCVIAGDTAFPQSWGDGRGPAARKRSVAMPSGEHWGWGLTTADLCALQDLCEQRIRGNNLGSHVDRLVYASRHIRLLKNKFTVLTPIVC